jgi:hypothetical protein
MRFSRSLDGRAGRPSGDGDECEQGDGEHERRDRGRADEAADVEAAAFEWVRVRVGQTDSPASPLSPENGTVGWASVR